MHWYHLSDRSGVNSSHGNGSLREEQRKHKINMFQCAEQSMHRDRLGVEMMDIREQDLKAEAAFEKFVENCLAPVTEWRDGIFFERIRGEALPGIAYKVNAERLREEQMPGLALGFPASRVGSGPFGLVFGPGLGSAVPGVALVLLWLQENLPLFFLFASFSLLVLFDNNRAT
jgi:hypothetical protein